MDKISGLDSRGCGSASIKFHIRAKKLSMWQSFEESVTALRVEIDDGEIPLSYSNTLKS